MSFFMRSLFRTVPLIGALLLSASPAVADDFLYLKCKGTIKSTVFDWNLIKRVKELEQDTVIVYKLDINKKIVFVSSEPEIANQFETDLNQLGSIAWKTEYSKEGIFGEDTTHLQYDPPGEVGGTMYQSDRDRRLEYEGTLSGSCKGSDASAYEAST